MGEAIQNVRGRHAFLSNFFIAALTHEGLVYPSVEHAYQAAKTLDIAARNRIRDAMTPRQAKRMGRLVSLRPDWDLIKVEIMRTLIREKFTNPRLAASLLSTGTAELVETNSWADTFWGVCHGSGQDWLGRLLMECRANLEHRRLTETTATTPKRPPRQARRG